MTETEKMIRDRRRRSYNCDTCAYAAGHSKCRHNCAGCTHKNGSSLCLCFTEINAVRCKYYEEESAACP